METSDTSNSTKKKIGIMGGTFNPIHAGHLMLAQWAMEDAELDRILFIPAGCPYMKDTNHVLDGKNRLKMVELAIEGNPYFAASGMEIVREGYTYTCDTLEQLQAENKNASLYFIMGADCLYSIEKWKDPERIFKACTVIAAARNASPIEKMEKKCLELKEKFGAGIRLLQFPAIELSSTNIRERVANQQSIRYMVPENVRAYICDNHLYQIS